MKNINKIALLGFGSVLLFASCKKYDGDSYDFSNTAKKYIKLQAGQTIEINSEMVDSTEIVGTDTTEYYYYVPTPAVLKTETREGMPKAVNYVVEYKTDNKTADLNGVLNAFTVLSNLSVSTDDSEFGTNETITGTLTLKSATGMDLRLGYPQAGNGLKVNFVANKPYILHEK
ncbi:hypothetical protein DBR32_04190 [Taibaiella sp. KBW10]|uniref:hypothetical protein n=1 Tax=Taibaiella sp. KBW10 TaxID=2153357 RepID=UPI000F5B0699|nr:hypothetical protein [Taibaiella sp. KBW10]RQO32008.1 hypothetical protein DBR32_04190 [Taibaiella sp. KBW10]